MGRIYTASFDDVSISAVQDLLSVKASAAVAIAIHQIVLGQRSLTSWEARPLRFMRYSGAFTDGSGGNAATPRPHSTGDAAAVASARINDTTTFSGGTSLTLLTDEWVFLNNYLYLPAPEDRIILAPSQAFVLRLPTAPSAGMSASGSITFEEIG